MPMIRSIFFDAGTSEDTHCFAAGEQAIESAPLLSRDVRNRCRRSETPTQGRWIACAALFCIVASPFGSLWAQTQEVPKAEVQEIQQGANGSNGAYHQYAVYGKGDPGDPGGGGPRVSSTSADNVLSSPADIQFSNKIGIYGESIGGRGGNGGGGRRVSTAPGETAGKAATAARWRSATSTVSPPVTMGV